MFNITGGSGGSTVYIKTLAEFIKYVAGDIPRVLVISDQIQASTKTKVLLGSSKTISGSNGKAMLYNIYLSTDYSTHNIIFRNLIFKHSVANKGLGDIQLFLNYGSAYWINNCSFIGHEWSRNDGSEDKLLYIGEKATGATISNCFFGNHMYGLIFGHPSNDLRPGQSVYDTRVTIFNNRFENIYDRAPGLFRFGHFHVYNNYINNYGLGFTVENGGKVISQNNYFGKSFTKNGMLDNKGGGEFTDIGSVPPILNQLSSRNDWRPPYHYKLKPTPDSAKHKYG